MKAPIPEEDATRFRTIRVAIRNESLAWRQRHPWLSRHQSAVGALLQAASVAGVVAAIAAYVQGLWPAWLVVVSVALATSIVHEIEHDLIHKQYFPRQDWVRHLMLLAGWLVRPSTVNPWIRRHLHIEHHRISGTKRDLEERAITNGERWGLGRFLMTFDPFLAIVLRLGDVPKGKVGLVLAKGAAGYFPLGWAHTSLWYGMWLHLLGVPLPLSPAALQVCQVLVVGLVLPNVLRTFCLHFVSSNIHYYGDIEAGNALKQTQVWNRWYLFPLQLFCFNFGSTHAIHHFWVPEPFYLRQATAASAHRVMREHGVRFNDFHTLLRANRYHREPLREAASQQAPLQALAR